MPDDVRGLLERGVEGYIPPRDALDRAIGLSVTAGGHLLRAFPPTEAVQRSPSPSAQAVDTPSEELKDVHRSLERVLADLWTTTVVADELDGEIEAARVELAILEGEGRGHSPRARRTVDLIRRFSASAARERIQEAELREVAQRLRDRREELIPLVNPAVFPETVAVTCSGDGTGGTAISTPLVRAGPANGLQIRVMNQFSNLRVFLRARGFGVLAVIGPGSSREMLITDVGGRTLDLVCTYGRPLGARPAHPVTVAHEDGSSPPCEVGDGRRRCP